MSKGRPKGLTASRACPLEGAAQVVSLNGVIASQAVTEVLQLLTGFGGAGLRRSHFALPHEPDLQRGFRKLDGVRGTLEDWGASRRPDCSFCVSALGAGAKLTLTHYPAFGSSMHPMAGSRGAASPVTLARTWPFASSRCSSC